MRIVAYVCELPPAADADPAFAQGERLRAWAAEHGHRIVAECRDGVDTADRSGFSAALAIVEAQVVDALAVASLSILGDPYDQEIRLWELRRRGLPVLSTARGDDDLLSTDDPVRLTARTVLERLTEHHQA